MNYHAHIEGFTGQFFTVAELKAWAEALIRRYPDLIGKKAQVWKAKVPGEFVGPVTREIVIGG